ncbi:hypothetical protein KJ750_00875 [Patescibacteria group bacterium]|nr:hypothetical protein [Patescibacteria group bacterium]MBU2263200.1 hypothetical protein [Patescibacteria group bacterium]
MNSRNLVLIVSLSVFLLTASFVFAETNLPTITVFYSKDCPHCHDELSFLENLKKEIPDLEIIELEVKYNEKNREVFIEALKKFDIKNAAVPITFIGNEYIIGFSGPENTGEKIRQIINDSKTTDKDAVSHPLFGKINIQSVSLPFLTLVLGTLDGFNPCSMWALLVLLTLVIATGSRKKVWLVGGIFITTSAISYFLFMSAWLNAFILLDYAFITRIIVGIIAVAAGIISIKEFYTFKPDTCEISNEGQKKKTTQRIKKVLGFSSLPILILGVIGIALSVNLVELLCSLGLPVVYTKALAMHQLASWKYYLYIALYDFFYMLDDIIVLLVAGFSMRFLQLNSKYSRYSRLIAGILMLILGAIFLLKPELLMFG